MKLEDALAGHGGIGILAQGRERVGLHRAAAAYFAERIHISRRKRHDAAAGIALAHACGHEGVHCPRGRRVLGSAELQPDQVNDAQRLGQAGEGIRVQEIATGGLHASIFEPSARALVAETAHGYHIESMSGYLGRPACQHAQRRSHFAPRAQDEQRAGKLLDEFDQPVVRSRQHFLQLGLGADGVRVFPRAIRRPGLRRFLHGLDKYAIASAGTTAILDCGGKRSATPLWLTWPRVAPEPKRRRRCALPAHSTGRIGFLQGVLVALRQARPRGADGRGHPGQPLRRSARRDEFHRKQMPHPQRCRGVSGARYDCSIEKARSWPTDSVPALELGSAGVARWSSCPDVPAR